MYITPIYLENPTVIISFISFWMDYSDITAWPDLLVYKLKYKIFKFKE